MSDHAQLARTGVGGALVIGGTAYTGWWLLLPVLAVVAIGAVLVRFGFRPGRSAGQK